MEKKLSSQNLPNKIVQWNESSNKVPLNRWMSWNTLNPENVFRKSFQFRLKLINMMIDIDVDLQRCKAAFYKVNIFNSLTVALWFFVRYAFNSSDHLKLNTTIFTAIIVGLRISSTALRISKSLPMHNSYTCKNPFCFIDSRAAYL